jgi:stage III sporulation protein SpoIIIAA
MDLTKEAYKTLVHGLVNRATGIDIVATRHGFNVEESAKNGSAETIIGMISEFQSTLRVLKRRLINTLPLETQVKYSNGE